MILVKGEECRRIEMRKGVSVILDDRRRKVRAGTVQPQYKVVGSVFCRSH